MLHPIDRINRDNLITNKFGDERTLKRIERDRTLSHDLEKLDGSD
jgi:hypothetical protein